MCESKQDWQPHPGGVVYTLLTVLTIHVSLAERRQSALTDPTQRCRRGLAVARRRSSLPVAHGGSGACLARNNISVHYTAGTFNMPTSYQQWVWEREANIIWSMVTCQGSTRSELARNLLALRRRTLGSERHRYAIA